MPTSSKRLSQGQPEAPRVNQNLEKARALLPLPLHAFLDWLLELECQSLFGSLQ
jgi:hypothetical protein